MEIIRLDKGQLGARLKSDASGLTRVLRNAVISSAQRGRSFIISKSPVDRGLLKVAWRVVSYPASVSSFAAADLVNDQPYAGVIEAGARPFKISSEGIFYLKAWVMRKLRSGEMNGRSSIKTQKIIKRRKTAKLEREAESIAYAIAKHFEKAGIKGRRFVYLNLPKLAELMDAEINRYLTKFFNRPVSGTP